LEAFFWSTTNLALSCQTYVLDSGKLALHKISVPRDFKFCVKLALQYCFNLCFYKYFLSQRALELSAPAQFAQAGLLWRIVAQALAPSFLWIETLNFVWSLLYNIPSIYVRTIIFCDLRFLMPLALAQFAVIWLYWSELQIAPAYCSSSPSSLIFMNGDFKFCVKLALQYTFNLCWCKYFLRPLLRAISSGTICTNLALLWWAMQTALAFCSSSSNTLIFVDRDFKFCVKLAL